jgi:hypothetical protein
MLTAASASLMPVAAIRGLARAIERDDPVAEAVYSALVMVGLWQAWEAAAKAMRTLGSESP